MVTESHLLLALEMLTEGSAAEVPEALRAEAETVHKKARPWTTGKNIQGLGVGARITDGEQFEELVLKVYVAKKNPRTKARDLVPRELSLPAIHGKIHTDVEEIGKVVLEMNTTQVRPAMPGTSVGRAWGPPGTLGCLVRKRDDDKSLYVLSNAHILVGGLVGAKGDKILQPAKAIGGKPSTDTIAELTEWVPLQHTPGYPNLVDAAIARLKTARNATSGIRLIGVPQGVSRIVSRGMHVQKTGAMTDYTIGLIKDINFRTTADFWKPRGGIGPVGFRDQVLCTRFTASGDSGAAVLNMQEEVVGLHFAGSPSTSVFNRISHVLDALNIDVVTHSV
jgi:hypothetical protein